MLNCIICFHFFQPIFLYCFLTPDSCQASVTIVSEFLLVFNVFLLLTAVMSWYYLCYFNQDKVAHFKELFPFFAFIINVSTMILLHPSLVHLSYWGTFMSALKSKSKSFGAKQAINCLFKNKTFNYAYNWCPLSWELKKRITAAQFQPL